MPTQSAAAEKISLYQPDQEDLIFPETPVFDQVADDREYRKKHLVAACRAFDYHGFDYGFAGHLTIRDPEFPELYWTNPMCVHFSQVRMSNLILVDHKGQVVEGDYAVNRARFRSPRSGARGIPGGGRDVSRAYGVWDCLVCDRSTAGYDQPGCRGVLQQSRCGGGIKWCCCRGGGEWSERRQSNGRPPGDPSSEPRPIDNQPAQYRRRSVLVHCAGAMLQATNISRVHRSKAATAR